MLPQFGTAVRKKNLDSAVTADLGGGAPDKASVDAAWLVLEAANDLGDHAAIDACRRVIDAELNGTVAGSSDIDLVLGYFR
ncbi:MULTISPECIES: hypothetical protein [unclassified Bradyrhizobium]|uniref:hypothetical protein n=1 Tax=unclassified Bradyrhizobium TaxID=2631580 RepID=UPI0027D68738|nr:hypothetical protein TM233_13140 [Bradyrhizobium sp. TM233]GMO98666.1 hypothetical protein TM239_19110 [Bradyrhizobium sp. TM239]